jgi:hypothetical protein
VTLRVVTRTGDGGTGSGVSVAMRGRLATCAAVSTAAFGYREAGSIPVDSTKVSAVIVRVEFTGGRFR